VNDELCNSFLDSVLGKWALVEIDEGTFLDFSV
jgi:hypothetical protein